MEILHPQFAEHLKKAKAGKFAPVYLFFGDELLAKRAFGLLLDAMLPAGAGDLNYESVEGPEAGASEVIARLFTYPLFPATKLVAWHGSLVLSSARDAREFLEKAMEAHKEGGRDKAARQVLSYLSVSGLALEDLDPADPGSGLRLAPDDALRGPWLAETVRFCQDRHLPVPRFTDESDLLMEALEKGPPPDNHLAVLAEATDKRKRLYKYILKAGVAVDCSVPSGDRRADADARRETARAMVQDMLSAQGKALEPAALEALLERLPPDMRSMAMSVEKLAAYAGTRKRITLPDVLAVVGRAKKDPVYVFTGALLDRDPDQALLQVSRLLEDKFHPLAIMGALANAIRRLLAARLFLDGPDGAAWNPRMNFRAFQEKVLPRIVEHDQRLAERLRAWEQDLQSGEEPEARGKGLKESQLFCAQKQNPYAVYQTFLKAGNFSTGKLLDILRACLAADRSMKTTPASERVLLESIVLEACGG